MASFLFSRLFVSLIIVAVVHFSNGANTNSLPFEIDKERAQLIKDAVGWMTFRRNGQVATDQDLEQMFVNRLLEKYVKSKLYRTFIIAFQLGVLPKLTLQEGESCDPAYTQQYRDPRNKSVTWHFQKQFTFDLYSKRDSSTLKLCDYRQGLVCHQQTSKCQCPEGSSMSSIDGSSSIRRCLVKQDEICASIDLDDGNYPDQRLLAGNLYHLAFNLEKPLSCEHGTQCRFKAPTVTYPRCFKSGPWFPITSGPGITTFGKGLGEECVIDLYAHPGACDPNGGVGNFKELTCYNYGPPRGNPNAKDVGKIGFCGPYYGSFGIAGGTSYNNNKYYYNPLLVAFVHPRTVPLRGSELMQYYEKLLAEMGWGLGVQSGGTGVAITRSQGDACSVSKTEEFEKEWKYFASLEDAPPPGQDYVPQATKAELDAHLETLADFSRGNNYKKRVCQVYTFTNAYSYTRPDLKCVKEGTPDANGNDGKCRTPGNLDTTDFENRLQKSLADMNRILTALENEEKNYDNKILEENPDPPCHPDLGPLPKDVARSGVVPTLKGGHCPDDAVCFDDFSDARGIFDQDCNLKGDAPQRLVCHDLNQPLDRCEKEHLQKMVNMTLDKLDKFAKLEMGKTCYLQFETALRNGNSTAIDELGEYRILGWLNQGLLCKQKTDKLECVSGQNETTCQCIGGKCPTPEATKPNETSGAGNTWGKMIRGSGLVGMQFLMMLTVQ